jgi:hypothetical protein
VFAKGAIVTANVTMTGTGRVTLAGVTKGVTAKLDGISSLFVDAATGTPSSTYCFGDSAFLPCSAIASGMVRRTECSMLLA